MIKLLLLAGVFAFGTVELPAQAADSNGAHSSVCKKKRHGKKKRHVKKAATPVRAPAPSVI